MRGQKLSQKINVCDQNLTEVILTSIGLDPLRSELARCRIEIKYRRFALMVSLASSGRIGPRLVDGSRDISGLITMLGRSNAVKVCVILRRRGKVGLSRRCVPVKPKCRAKGRILAIAILSNQTV